MVLLQMNPQTGRQQRESFTKPKWNKQWLHSVLSRITTSRCIAVKWYLRVYWLLPLSIVDSFKKHRRFFCLESTILLESTDEYLGQSINFISQRSLFLISTDSSWLRQCATRTTQLFYLTHWISLCAIWWRTKMMKSGECPCQVLVTQNLLVDVF